MQSSIHMNDAPTSRTTDVSRLMMHEKGELHNLQRVSNLADSLSARTSLDQISNQYVSIMNINPKLRNTIEKGEYLSTNRRITT